MRKKVGLITIGCRENRPDWEDVIRALEPEVEVDFRGVLDGLTPAGLELIPQENGDLRMMNPDSADLKILFVKE